MTIRLSQVSRSAADAILAGERPDDVIVAPDYPTEFSTGVAAAASEDLCFGPYFIHRGADDVVVGEIGGSMVEAGVVEIGYAVVESQWGRGYATAAVQALVERAADNAEVERFRAHTPFDRPASARVVEKVGFRFAGDVEDEHDGEVLRVQRWELARDGSGRG